MRERNIVAERETEMAVAEAQPEKTWHGIVLETLKRNDIRLVPTFRIAF